MSYPKDMNDYAREIHEIAVAKGFWDHERIALPDDPTEPKYVAHQTIANPSIYEEKLMLIVSEVAEVLEARRDKNDELEAEECADVLIRVFDYMYARGFSVDHAVINKMNKNRDRERLHGRQR